MRHVGEREEDDKAVRNIAEHSSLFILTPY